LTSDDKTVNKDNKPQTEDEPFEKQLERLENIVRQLEKGETSLEDSLKVFEEGVRLARMCSARLDQIQGKVEVLLQQEHGEPTIQPLSEGSSNADEWSTKP